MSLISDALKRAEQQRLNPVVVNPTPWETDAAAPVASRSEPQRSSPSSLFFLNVVALIAVFAFGLYYFRAGPQPIDSSTSERAGGTSEQSVSPVAVASTEVSPSPAFSDAVDQPARTVPAAAASTTGNVAALPTSTVATPPTTSDYELGGTSGVGSTTLLSIVRRDDKRSLWVPVGKTVAEVTAVSYDPDVDRAVIRVRGNLMTVVARDVGTGPSGPKPAE